MALKTPPTQPEPRPSPAEERRVHAGIDASERDEAIELTPDEAEAYYETGVLPKRVMTWAASRE
jgi:hypothetical protein